MFISLLGYIVLVTTKSGTSSHSERSAFILIMTIVIVAQPEHSTQEYTLPQQVYTPETPFFLGSS